MVYITGDTHGGYTRFGQIKRFVRKNRLSNEDIVVVLGDMSVNFSLNERDEEMKTNYNKLGPKFFCIHGNHEQRPATISSYYITEFCGGKVYVEDKYPNLYFAIDGEIYDLDGYKTIVIGGAYSVDKFYRIARTLLRENAFSPLLTSKITEYYYKQGNVSRETNVLIEELYKKADPLGKSWWPDEQPSEEIKQMVEKVLSDNDWQIDVVLSHTSPFSFEPTDVFLSDIDQNSVDSSTEHWLDTIEKKLDYKHWYAGHFHVNRQVTEKFTFLFENMLPIGEVLKPKEESDMLQL